MTDNLVDKDIILLENNLSDRIKEINSLEETDSLNSSSTIRVAQSNIVNFMEDTANVSLTNVQKQKVTSLIESIIKIFEDFAPKEDRVGANRQAVYDTEQSDDLQKFKETANKLAKQIGISTNNMGRNK